MKAYKFFSIAAVAALLLAPATAMAKTHLSFSLNLFDCLAPMFAPVPVLAPVPVIVAPPPPPVYYYVPCHPRPRAIVREYHHYYNPVARQEPVEEINPSPCRYQQPQPR